MVYFPKFLIAVVLKRSSFELIEGEPVDALGIRSAQRSYTDELNKRRI